MRWEYYIIVIQHIEDIRDIEIIFNSRGEKGYELVSISDGVAFFRRPKLSESDKVAVEGYFGGKVG